MAAAVLKLTDGNSDNDINLLNDSGVHVGEAGIETLSLPGEGNRVAFVFHASSGTSTDDMLLNINKLNRMLDKARQRMKQSLNPIVEIEYQPTDATTTNKKFVYDGHIVTSPFAGGIESENKAGRRTHRSMRLELQTEPHWRGALIVLNNLVQNSDFEYNKANDATPSGTTPPDGWSERDNGGNAAYGYPTTVKKYGRQSCRYKPTSANNQNDGLIQTITGLTASTAYAFSCWVKVDAGTVKVLVKDTSGATTTIGTSTSSTLTQMTGTHTTASGITSIDIEFIQNAQGSDDYYIDSVMLIEASTLPSGYIAGGTFDNQDTTLLDKHGEVIIADLKGDVPPLVRIAVENPTANGYRRCWMGTHRIESGDVPMKFALDAVDALQTGTDVAEGAQPDLDGHHLAIVGSSTDTTVAGTLTETIEGPSASIPLSTDGPTLSIRPRRYHVYARLGNEAKLSDFILKSTADSYLIAEENIAISGSAGADLDFIYLGDTWIPPVDDPNQTTAAKDMNLDIIWKAASGTTKLDCMWFFPADEGFAVLQQAARISAAYSTALTWVDGTADFLTLENISDPSRKHYGVGSTYNVWANEKVWDFRGEVPQFAPNQENRLCVFTQRNENLARLDETFKIRLDYTPLYITPRGD
jgi:hypothetical protein